MRTRFTAALALAVGFALVGCGPEKAEVPTDLSRTPPPKPGITGSGPNAKPNMPNVTGN